MRLQTFNTPNGPVVGAECDLHDISAWNPTVAQLRSAIQGGRIVGPQLPGNLVSEEGQRMAPTQREVDNLNEMAIDALTAGRLIDFGMMPNAVLMETAHRAGPLYTRGAIGHPFRQPWLLYHTWEGGTALYLVNLLEPDNPAGGDTEVAELSPVSIKGVQMITIGDRVILEPDPDVELLWNTYAARACPSVWRYIPGAEREWAGRSAASAAAGNVLDPLMTALLMLSTNGVRRETIVVSPKLNKARARNGKPSIPSYDRVHAEAYVTAVLAKSARRTSEPRGGTHASPVPHIRRGHMRTYASGTKTFIRDSLVNFTDDARAAYQTTRSHYAMPTIKA